MAYRVSVMRTRRGDRDGQYIDVRNLDQRVAAAGDSLRSVERAIREFFPGARRAELSRSHDTCPPWHVERFRAHDRYSRYAICVHDAGA